MADNKGACDKCGFWDNERRRFTVIFNNGKMLGFLLCRGCYGEVIETMPHPRIPYDRAAS